MDFQIDPAAITEELFSTKVGDGHLIDGDTLRTKDGESIRILNIDTPEVAHSDDFADPDFHAAGAANHKEIARLANEYGFTEPYRSGKKDSYGRTLGDLMNPETGERLSHFLVREGITPATPWSDKASTDQSLMGMSQRNAGMEREDSIQRAFDAVWDANGELTFKTNALNEQEFDPEIHAGVSLRRLDRTIDNKALKPLSTAFDTALIGMGAGLQGMKQAVGAATGWEALEDSGRLGVAARQDELRRKPTVLVDYKDVDSISDGFRYITNNAIMSAPYMVNTMASMAAGAAVGSVGGPLGTVAGAVVGLASPTSIYAGQVYNGQDEKNWQVAISSGFAQAMLDRLGVKGIQNTSSIKSIMNEAKDKLIAGGLSPEEAMSKVAAASKTELMGLVNDADNIVKQHLRARAVTRTIVNRAAKGMGTEAATEAAQETLGHMGENWNEENLGLFDHDSFNSEFIDRITNAAIAGGTLGGAFGTAGGIREVGGWADAAFDRGAARTGFHDTLAALEDQNETLGEQYEKMERGVQDNTDIAFRVNQDRQDKSDRNMTEKAVETIQNAPLLWRGMMRARMSKDSLVKSSAWRQIAATYAGTLGRIKPGQQYEDAMHHIKQGYVNLMGADMRNWVQGLDRKDGKSVEKFSNIMNQVHEEYNEWFENNTDNQGNFKDGVTIDDFDWSKWDHIESDGFRDNLSENTNNMVRQFFDRQQIVAKTMRERQNRIWAMNAKWKQDERTGEMYKENLPPKIKKLNNYLGKFKALKRDEIGRRRGDFEMLLRSEYGMSKEGANELTSKILDGEPLDGHDDSVFDLISKGVPNTAAKKRTMGLASNPKFNEFFNQNVFENMNEAMRQAARFETYHRYVGRDNWRVAQLLDKAAAEGVPQKEVNRMALAIQNYLEAQSGNYKRPAKGSYGERALTVQKNLLFWSLTTSLPLSALSSTVELMLTVGGLTKTQIFKNLNKMGHELAMGFVSYGSSLSRDLWTGKEFIAGSPQWSRLTHLGFMNWEAGAASTVGVTETSEWSKYLVDRFFKYNGLQDLTNATRAMRMATFYDFVTNHVAMIKNGDPKSEGYRFANEQLRNLGLPVERYITLLDKMDAEGNFANPQDKIDFEEMQNLAEYTYINQTVALPGAANRPLFYQDPRMALFTQFNGYISTFTANHLPKMWSEYVARGRPSMKFNTFAMMVMMIMMGYASQYLKDWIKYGESTPYLNTQEKLRRAINSSGLLGQGERALNFVWPQFEGQSSSMVGKAADKVLGEMPAMGPIGRLMKAADSAYGGDTDTATYHAMRATPVVGPFTSVAEKVSGLDFSEYKNNK